MFVDTFDSGSLFTNEEMLLGEQWCGAAGGFGAAGSCTNGSEMQLVFVLHHYLHHHHQLLVTVATFTDCNENHPHRTDMETAHHATAC